MCIGGGGGSTPPPAAPPPPPRAAAPVTISRLSKQPARKGAETRGQRRRGSKRSSLIIPKSGVQYSGSGSGVNV